MNNRVHEQPESNTPALPGEYTLLFNAITEAVDSLSALQAALIKAQSNAEDLCIKRSCRRRRRSRRRHN